MANPQLPISQGGNLPGLNRDDDIKDDAEQEAQKEQFEQALGLDSDEVDQEVIELDDGSVVVNFVPKEGPQKNPEFYANLAEELDEDVLLKLAYEYLDYIDVDKEARKKRKKSSSSKHWV